MRLTWPEIRARAAAFSQRWKTAARESADKQSFWNEFFACFGVDPKLAVTYERRVANLPANRRGFIDAFIPGTLLIEHKSAHLQLDAAEVQGLDYVAWLPEAERPHQLLACNFQHWRLIDLETGRVFQFPLADLKKHVEAFAFIVGRPTREFRNQKPVNAAASRLLGDIHRALEAQGYAGHRLQLLLVRLPFVLFADDVGIWDKNRFLALLEERTLPDGRDLGDWIANLFDTLNTPETERQRNLDADLSAFPYVNGRLFEEPIGRAVFDNETRRALIDAARFNWAEVSPAIFGAIFESVIDRVTQRRQGAHYTPEVAIQRVIGPLFLDDLRAGFEALKARKDGGRTRALNDFHTRLGSLRFLDPACGAGNFLVVAYRELRALELELLKELKIAGQLDFFDVATLSRLNVDHFAGIEIDEFPAQIAQVALWMTDHIANMRLGEAFGVAYARIPLVAAPRIACADALEVDWNGVLPAAECTHVLGNPPFVGAKYQSPAQRAQVRGIARLGGSGGTLDYVAAWFVRAGEYVRGGEARIGFVATNSVCQGEQVAQFWPILWGRCGLEIAFAHRTFAWPGRAAVHCVVLGLAQRGDEPAEKRLFSYADPRAEPVESRHGGLTAYLFDAGTADRHLVVKEEARPINGARRLITGTKPVDGGYLIFTANERAAIEAGDVALDYLRPFLGAEEYINGGGRCILSLQDAPPSVIRSSALLLHRLRRVGEFRSGLASAKGKEDSKERGGTALKLANVPSSFHVTVIPEQSFLVIPQVSSERREYVPIGWLKPPIVPSDKLRLLPDATLSEFGVLTSRMHMAWMRQITGRMKSDYMYSVGVVYNTFPWPAATTAQRSRVEALAQAVLDARALPRNATSTLADLYDPDTMPAALRRAHDALDRAVDRLYRARGFAHERERVEHLFGRYEAMVHPTVAAPRANLRTRRRVARATARRQSEGTVDA